MGGADSDDGDSTAKAAPGSTDVAAPGSTDVAAPGHETDYTWTDGAPDDARRTDIETDELGAPRDTVVTAAMTPSGRSGDPLRKHATIGRYQITGTLGKGGMGVVYAARDPQLNRDIAIKVLRSHNRQRRSGQGDVRLLREAQALAQLSHPNVIAVHDVGSIGGDVFIAMERVNGSNLRAWLADSDRSAGEILGVFLSAARGLSAAHGAGLVHRDFKLDNVMMGDDGRVRVVDFGLARSADVTDEYTPVPDRATTGGTRAARDSESSENLLDSPLTHAGLVVGTPAYMAPEQLQGGAVDARADQFSMCASLYEALTGIRAFSSTERKQAYASKDASSLVQPLPSRQQPITRRLWHVMARGMATNPGDRFRSMDALVAALERATKRRWPLLAAVAILAVVGASALIVGTRDAASSPCEGAQRELAGTWSDTTRAELRVAFAATKLGHAATTAERTIGLLDVYGRRWVSMHTAACRAGRVDKTQSPMVTTLRMECLLRRRTRLGGLVSALTNAPTPGVVDSAIRSAFDLPSLDQCADETALLGSPRPPDDPAVRAAINDAHDALGRAKSLHSTGRIKAAATAAAAIAKTADKLGHPPLISEALHFLGRMQMKTSQLAHAEKTLHRAARVAATAKLDQRLADIWIDLVWCVGELQERPDEGIGLSKSASIAITRAGGQIASQAKLRFVLGALSFSKGDLIKTHEHFLASLTMRREVLSKDHPDVAESSDAVAKSLVILDRRKEAAPYAAQAQAIYLRTYGPDHPDTAAGYSAMASIASDSGNLAEAKRIYNKALGVYRRAYGDGHPAVASATENLGTVLYDMGDRAQGKKLLLQALAIRAKVLGNKHTRVAVSHFNLGLLFIEENKPQQAHAHLTQSLDIYHAVFPVGHIATADVLVAFGDVELLRKKPRAAFAPLSRAMKIELANNGSALAVARIQFKMARAEWRAGKSRARALRLARTAQSAMKSSKEPGATGELREIATWLKAHRR